VKQKQPSPTVTVTVVALATPGRKGVIEVIITVNKANHREEVFIALVFDYSHRRYAVELQTICCDTQ
jgi:succinyl-CoA synthetase beta subunit